MSRFQAQTNALLDRELENLGARLGLAPSQKADLLREVASIASWVFRQAERGRTVEARRGREVEPLAHPVLERIASRDNLAASMPALKLNAAELRRLADVLNRPFQPTPALRKALRNISSAKRKAPKLRWPGT